jgi:hypothetical protein
MELWLELYLTNLKEERMPFIVKYKMTFIFIQYDRHQRKSVIRTFFRKFITVAFNIWAGMFSISQVRSEILQCFWQRVVHSLLEIAPQK